MVTTDQFGHYQADTRPLAHDTAAIRHLSKVVWLYLIVVMTPLFFTLGPLTMTPLRSVLLVMVPILLVRLLSGKLGQIFATDIFFILHLAWGAVALVVNNPDQVVQQIGSVGIEFIGGYLVGRGYIRTRADFIALCKAVGLLVAFMLPFAIYETLTGNPIIITTLNKLPGLRAVGNVAAEKRMGLERAQGVFTNPIHFGLFCSSAFSLTLVALKNVLPTPRRLAIGVAVAGCVFFSLSSGALLPIIMQSFLIIWAASFCKIKFDRPWTVLLILCAIFYVVIDMLSNRTPLEVFFSYATFSSHNAYWRGIIFQWGMKSVWTYPWTGIGLNDWERPWFMYSGSMDNFWLVMAVRYGIPGFVLLAWGYFLGVWGVARRRFAADPALSQLRQAWMFTIVGLTFTLCTVHIWTSVYSFVFFVFGSGIWFIRAELNYPTASLDEGMPERSGSSDFNRIAEQGITQQPDRTPKFSRFPTRSRTAG